MVLLFLIQPIVLVSRFAEYYWRINQVTSMHQIKTNCEESVWNWLNNHGSNSYKIQNTSHENLCK